MIAHEYDRGARIFSQGDRADTIFYIGQGTVKLTVVSHDGREAIVALLEAGDFFGETCLVSQSRRMTTATATTRCAVWKISRRTVLAMLHHTPRFADFFLKHLLTRTVRLEQDLVDHLFNSAEKRLARTMLLLAHFGNGRRLEVVPKISQETLAEMIGATRERVSYFMNKFRRLGFIHYNGGLRVHSSLLTVILNGPPGPAPRRPPR